MDLVVIAERDAAKAVPFRFILPLVANRNFVYQARFHWGQRWFYGERHEV
jgi:hypothetical protein